MPRRRCLKNQGVTAKLGYGSGVALGGEPTVVGETPAAHGASLGLRIHQGQRIEVEAVAGRDREESRSDHRDQVEASPPRKARTWIGRSQGNRTMVVLKLGRRGGASVR